MGYRCVILQMGIGSPLFLATNMHVLPEASSMSLLHVCVQQKPCAYVKVLFDKYPFLMSWLIYRHGGHLDQ